MINKDSSQDKINRKLDKAMFKKTTYKKKQLFEETWGELNQRGASLVEQFEWVNFRRKQKEKHDNQQ